MDLEPPAFAIAPSPALPALFLRELAGDLRDANLRLRDVARAARARAAPSPPIERAIVEAWTSLAHVEHAAGLTGIVSRASGMRQILVVDDSPDMRYLMGRALRRLAPAVETRFACDAGEALALLLDVGDGEGVMVISDHEMGPGSTGAELLAQIASRHPRTHRVLFTGHPVDLFESAQVSAHAIVSKDSLDAIPRYLGAP